MCSIWLCSSSSQLELMEKIKAWLYDNMGSRIDYDARGHSSTTMAYNATRTRFRNNSLPLKFSNCSV